MTFDDLKIGMKVKAPFPTTMGVCGLVEEMYYKAIVKEIHEAEGYVMLQVFPSLIFEGPVRWKDINKLIKID